MSAEDRFVSPRPQFIVSTNQTAIETTVPQVSELPESHTPSLSMEEQLRQSGNDYLANLLSMAKELGAASAERESTSSKPRSKSSKSAKKQTATTQVAPAPKFLPEDVLSDEDFVKRTRSFIRMHHDSGEIVSQYEGYDIYQEEALRLFWANGGERHYHPMGDFGSAFDNLRAEKIRGLTKQLSVSILPESPKDGYQQARVIPLPGTPTQKEWRRRNEAEKVRQARQALGFKDEDDSDVG